MNETKKQRGFQPKIIEDPTVFTVYKESLIGDETLMARATKLLQALKIKYRNTVFYTQDSFEGINIKLKQITMGGQVIEASQSTLDSVSLFIAESDKTFGPVAEQEVEQETVLPITPFLVKRKM